MKQRILVWAGRLNPDGPLVGEERVLFRGDPELWSSDAAAYYDACVRLAEERGDVMFIYRDPAPQGKPHLSCLVEVILPSTPNLFNDKEFAAWVSEQMYHALEELTSSPTKPKE
jgi:hypothetical protein